MKMESLLKVLQSLAQDTLQRVETMFTLLQVSSLFVANNLFRS
jgi:hypothetical protein